MHPYFILFYLHVFFSEHSQFLMEQHEYENICIESLTLKFLKYHSSHRMVSINI
jgi:hypothetical protein